MYFLPYLFLSRGIVCAFCSGSSTFLFLVASTQVQMGLLFSWIHSRVWPHWLVKGRASDLSHPIQFLDPELKQGPASFWREDWDYISPGASSSLLEKSSLRWDKLKLTCNVTTATTKNQANGQKSPKNSKSWSSLPHFLNFWDRIHFFSFF